jgi:hypothetical protein
MTLATRTAREICSHLTASRTDSLRGTQMSHVFGTTQDVLSSNHTDYSYR